MSDGPCECVVCCDGEHSGGCTECGGWGDVEGDECTRCNATGTCRVCDGINFPEETEAGP